MKFSKRLQQQRKIKGSTQKVVAEHLGVSKVAVSRWELGHSVPSGEMLKNLAEYLNCSVEWLLNGDTYNDVSMIDFHYDDDPTVSAGNGYMSPNNIVEKMPIPSYIVNQQIHPERLRCRRITGRSMEPVLRHGSVVAINPSVVTIKDGMMYAIQQENLIRVKILIETPEAIIVRSFSHDFEDETYGKNELEVMGQVFWYSSYINDYP